MAGKQFCMEGPLIDQPLPTPPSRTTMAAELPGAAFLQRRLARAQALPPGEHSPEVQAFITSVELGRQIAELLPLADDGRRAALPLAELEPATTRRCGAMDHLFHDEKMPANGLIQFVRPSHAGS